MRYCNQMLKHKFKGTKNILFSIKNVVSKGEHVKQIERFHRVLEERAQCYYAMLPFKSLPKMMVVQLLLTVCF